MAWAWRLVSRDWVGLWGQPDYPALPDRRRKTIVILTDGYTAGWEIEVGGALGTPFGWNRGGPLGFENFVRVCDAAKAETIEIHVIVTTSGNSAFRPYAQRCATSPAHFHEVGSTAALASAFGRITTRETRVRLTR
jgi:hypothetical protein